MNEGRKAEKEEERKKYRTKVARQTSRERESNLYIYIYMGVCLFSPKTLVDDFHFPFLTPPYYLGALLSIPLLQTWIRPIPGELHL